MEAVKSNISTRLLVYIPSCSAPDFTSLPQLVAIKVPMPYKCAYALYHTLKHKDFGLYLRKAAYVRRSRHSSPVSWRCDTMGAVWSLACRGRLELMHGVFCDALDSDDEQRSRDVLETTDTCPYKACNCTPSYTHFGFANLIPARLVLGRCRCHACFHSNPPSQQ